MQLIGEGATSKVYDNGDGTVTKVFKGKLNEVCPGIDIPNMKYVANFREPYVIGESSVAVGKEKIEKHDYLAKDIIKLSSYWDNALVSSYDLFDFINEYLRVGRIEFRGCRANVVFVTYLTFKAGHNYYPSLFVELCELVQELRDNDVYNVDWNEKNFGRKNGHLALFELGGAKLHKKK